MNAIPAAKTPEFHVRAAIVYDFDGTLIRGNLQERSFIPDIGITRGEFWAEVKARTKQCDGDEILVYMRLMIEKAHARGLQVTETELYEHGRDAPLFPGLENGEWFDRINQHGKTNDIDVDHYVISSGILEMIRGCPIYDRFQHVFASKFMFENSEAIWPGVAINYTTKTQYLFRINKGIENQWDNEAINAYKPEGDRPVPFDRMIFIGDGYTDIPAMKMLTYKGGHSIAVYDERQRGSDLVGIRRLISDNRVNFVAPADYREDSSLDIIVKGILGRIRAGAVGNLWTQAEGEGSRPREIRLPG